jgi:hypothetical protein
VDKKKLGIGLFLLAGILILSAIAYVLMTSGDSLDLPWNRSEKILVEESLFENPKLQYRPYRMLHNLGGAWDNNKAVTLEQKMDYLVRIGYGGIVTNVAWNKDYLQRDSGFTAMNRTLDAAEERGLGLWLYDEYWYPSGYANQLTLEGYPEYQAVGITQLFRFGMEDETIRVLLPDSVIEVVGVYIFPIEDGVLQSENGQKIDAYTISEDQILSVQGRGSDWKICIFLKVPVFTEKNLFEDVSGQIRNAPNLLNRDAVQRFMDVTHKKYEEMIPEFSHRIKAFFTDEPSLWTSRYLETEGPADYPLIPWEDRLPDAFELKFDYSLMPYLGSLFAGDSDFDRQIRQNYYEIVGDLFSENYTGQIQDWCESNGTQLSGHYLFEESLHYQIQLYGDLFKTLCRAGFPGVDNLPMNPQTFFSGGLYNATKLASSAARYRDIPTVMLELCPVDFTGDYYETHHENAMGSISMQYLAGVRHTNLYYNPAATNNEEALIFNTYTGRLGYMLDGAVMNSGIGVFYSTMTAQQYPIPSRTQNLLESNYQVSAIESGIQAVVNQLARANLDFDYFNEQIMEQATVGKGILESGSARYRVIIVPSVEVIPLATLEKLHQFASSGGKLIFTGCLPDRSNLQLESESVRQLALNYEDNLMSLSPVGNVSNLALGAAVYSTSLDSSSGIYRTEYITDGTANPFSFAGSWSGSSSATITIDLGQPQNIDSAMLYTQFSYEMRAYELWYEKDGEWVKLLSVENNSQNTILHSFDTIHTQRVRIQVLEGSVNQPNLARINEFELYYTGNEKNQDNLMDRIRQWSGVRLNVQAADPIQNQYLFVSPYMKVGGEFHMIVNSSKDPIALVLDQRRIKTYRVYDPYDGSTYIVQADQLVINGNRALFVQAYQ